MAGDTINVYIGGSVPDPRIDTILAKLGELMSANSEAFDAIAKRIDDATTAISDKIDALVAQIATGMSQTEVDALKAKFTVEADKLDALGKPGDPIVVPPLP